MKIAYICQTYPPVLSGVSTVMHCLASGMHSRHHAGLVISASETGTPYTVEDDSFKVVRLRSFVTPKTVNQRFMPLPIGQISAELQTFAPDIVHAHDPYVGGILVKIKRDSQGIWPLVYTAHLQPAAISPHISPVLGLRKFLEKMMTSYGSWLVRSCDVVIAPSEYLAKFIRRRTGRDIIVISNGVDIKKFNSSSLTKEQESKLREKYHLHPNLPIILHVGRLSEEKRVEIIIHAAAKVMQASAAQLVIIGDGSAKESLEHLSAELGIQDNTFFTGFIPHDGDLPGMYRLGNIFVIASEVEAQGVVILEALASGLPVAAVRSGSIPELIAHQQNGFLASPNDYRSMASQIQSLLQDPNIATKMGKAGRVLAENHSHENSLDEHEKLYQSLLAT